MWEWQTGYLCYWRGQVNAIGKERGGDRPPHPPPPPPFTPLCHSVLCLPPSCSGRVDRREGGRGGGRGVERRERESDRQRQIYRRTGPAGEGEFVDSDKGTRRRERGGGGGRVRDSSVTLKFGGWGEGAVQGRRGDSSLTGKLGVGGGWGLLGRKACSLTQKVCM